MSGNWHCTTNDSYTLHFLFLGTVRDGNLWLQGKLDNSSGIWRYSDGTEMQFFNWNTGGSQPNGNENEIYIITRRSQGYRWHDIYTNEKFPVMCQKKK